MVELHAFRGYEAFGTARERALGTYAPIFANSPKPSRVVSNLVSIDTSEPFHGTQIVQL